jgi:sec-independent protein translocase protein TatA
MGLSWWHILIVLLVFVLLFGTGKISGLMGDLAKGIKSFKKEMSEGQAEEAAEAEPEPRVIEHKPVAKPAPRRTKTETRTKTARARKSS